MMDRVAQRRWIALCFSILSVSIASGFKTPEVIPDPESQVAFNYVKAGLESNSIIESDIPYLAFFTTFPEVGANASKLERILKLAVASCSNQTVLQRSVPKKVGDSNVYVADLRDLHWRIEDWRLIAFKRNSYINFFPEEFPLVMRADEFINLVVDQTNDDGSFNDSYFRLLHSWQIEKDNIKNGTKRPLIPTTIAEIREFWHVDNDPNNRVGQIVGNSGVNKQGTRWLESRPLPLGYYYQTFDSKHLTKDHDPVEHPDGNFLFDGSEVIVGMPKKWIGTAATPGQIVCLQAYYLTDGAGKLVGRAPVDLVEDTIGFKHYREIRNWGSCELCHGATGINIPLRNIGQELVFAGMNFHFASLLDAEAFEGFHLTSPTRFFENAIDAYTTGVILTCDLGKDEPASSVAVDFKFTTDRYEEELDLERSAYELRIPWEQWRKVLTGIEPGSNAILPARFASLVHGGEELPNKKKIPVGTIPRSQFKEYYIKAYTAVHGGPPIPPTETEVKTKNEKPTINKQSPPQRSNTRTRR